MHSTKHGPSEKMDIQETGSWSSPDTESPGSLILGLQPPEPGQISVHGLSYPVYVMFIIVAGII